MANIQQKHVRGSSTVKGPIKATETFGLIKASRTCGDFSLVRPGESAVRKPQRRSPESRTSPECIVSPGLKEQQRRRQSPRPFDAVEAVNLYVKGAWPREPGSHPYQADKAVQTESDYTDELTDARGRPILHRSSSAGRGDAGRREKVRSALLKPNKPISQKTSSSPSLWCSRGTSTPRPAPRASPTPISTMLPNANSTSPLSHRTKPIHIPMARVLPMTASVIKGSVEGDNMEIEKLWACLGQPANMNTCGDGRQAPVMELLCHPGNTVRGEEDVSPLLPAGLIHTDHDHSPITEGTAGSPDIKDEELKPKSILVRLPPDGCEKVKVIDERRSSTSSSTDSFTLAKVGQWRLVPSAQSAFCPLLKPYVSQSGGVCESVLVTDQ